VSEPKSVRQIARGDLARGAYRTMELYAPNRKPCAIDLSDNTNLVGLPPSAKKELEAAASSTFTRYPSLYGADLKRALGERLGVSPDHIVTGCGSDDILDSAIRAFTEPGDALAFPDPTFAMLPSFATMNSLEERPIPLLEGTFDIDADRLVEAEAKVTYVCSPNNPTGTLASRSALDRVIGGARGVVILDEAYIEYALDTESLAARATKEDRLLVVRTLSKAFGLAGMRVGYAVGSRELVRAVEKSRGPYKVTGLAEKMATSALDHDQEWVSECIRDVLESRRKMETFFGERGLSPIASSANFLLVPVGGEARGDRSRDAMDLAQRLRDRGVGVRPFPGAKGIGDALRISVGPWSLMQRTLAAFDEVLG
jgi:histidinol-phosphate aminotransferase